MQNLIGEAVLVQLRVLDATRRYIGWASSNTINLVLSVAAMVLILIVGAIFVRKVIIPGVLLMTYPLWGPARRRKRIYSLKRAIESDPGGLHALSHLHAIAGYWGGDPVFDPEAAEDRQLAGNDTDGIPVPYPSRFYVLRNVPKGLVGAVKCLMQSLGGVEGWVFRHSRSKGKTEAFSSQMGFRI